MEAAGTNSIAKVTCMFKAYTNPSGFSHCTYYCRLWVWLTRMIYYSLSVAILIMSIVPTRHTHDCACEIPGFMHCRIWPRMEIWENSGLQITIPILLKGCGFTSQPKVQSRCLLGVAMWNMQARNSRVLLTIKQTKTEAAVTNSIAKVTCMFKAAVRRSLRLTPQWRSSALKDKSFLFQNKRSTVQLPLDRIFSLHNNWLLSILPLPLFNAPHSALCIWAAK